MNDFTIITTPGRAILGEGPRWVGRENALYWVDIFAPALHRLERQGWIKAEWRTSDQGRRAKYYALTPRGRKQLDKEVALWRRLSAAVAEGLDAV